ncbi:hypothetical protein SFRURICE_004841 [Spodoptera frugiperda]|nr:hypothetical protein SFRURICE_004841 [Spodoptera frugiperda]
MVLTRSRSGESKGEQTQQELSVTAGPGANTPAPESSSARVTDTGSGSTTTTYIDATLKASDTKSRRSTYSRRKRLAELEAIEQLQLADMNVQQAQAERKLKEQLQLAEMEVQQAQARRRLKEIQLQRLRVEAESSDDEELEDDLASVRIGTWLTRPAPPPGGETRPPPHDASGGRISRDAAHAARATYTGAPAGAQPLRDDDGYGKVCECVCSQTKGNIASEVSHGNVSDKLIDVSTLTAALAQVMRSSREPPKYMQRLPVFDGKPGEWIAYKAAYCDSHTYFSSVENIARIRISLRGAAKEAVGCLLFSQSDPQVILDALERRFGRPEALIMTELDKVKILPRLKEDPRDICIFASRIANTVGTIEALKRIHYLHSPEMSHCIIEKLTPILKHKWYDYAANRKFEDTPVLKLLSMFMNEEADKCSAYALPERDSDNAIDERRRRRVERTFMRNVNTAPPAPPSMTTHESVTSARVTTSPHNRRAYLKIVPVTLSGPHARIHTYALLDDGSTVTLLDASAAEILGADGPESSMCIQGLGTEFKHERSRTRTLGIPEKKSRRLPDSSFKKKKQEAPTVPKSHLGTLERLDKNEPRSKESRVIAATQDNRATPCDSSLSVPSTCSAGARILRLRGKIKSVQEVNWNIINPLVSARKSKYKKLHSSIRDNGNTKYPYPRTVNQVRPHDLNDYGSICSESHAWSISWKLVPPVSPYRRRWERECLPRLLNRRETSAAAHHPRLETSS